MKTQITVKHSLSSVAIILALTACTANKNSDLDDISRSAKDRDIIVRQSDDNEAVVSKHKRSYWVSARKTAKVPEDKIYATLATGSWDAAEAEARSLLQKKPNNAAALVVLATALSMQKKFALSAYYANAYEKAHGTSPEILNLKALAMLTSAKSRMQDFKAAADYFNEAFQASNSEIASGLNLGHLYLEIGDANAAADIFAEVKKRCGNCTSALIGSGVAHSRTRNYAEARSDFESTLKKSAHHPEALYRLALITYQGDKNIRRAKKYIDELMTYAPDNAFLMRQKAESLVRAMDAEGDPDDIEQAPMIADDEDKSDASGELKAVKEEN